MRHSAITRPIVKELNPIKLDAQGPHLAVPGEGKLAHGIELRPLLAVDGDADSLAGYRAHDKVPARYGLQDTFTGVVGLDYFAIVEEDAQGKEIQKALSDYQSVDDVYKRIKILENLLKHPKFGLYNIDGVEYLSKCCELELGQLKEDRMGIAHILLTLVSALLGGIANNTELSQILILAFGTAIVLVIILIIYWYRESSARTSQRKAYAILQQDLAYVRYQIQTSALKPTIYLPASSRNKKLPRRR